MIEEIKVGDIVDDFVLSDHLGIEHTLTNYRGKRVLLSFHPLAWTGICTEQMKSLEANADAFAELETAAFGISVDSAPCKKAWADDMGLENTPLLADFWPHGGLAQKLGLFIEEKGISKRANVILDEDGKAVFVKVYPIKELPDIDEILDFLR